MLLDSTLSPDMVTGSEQQHMPVATATSWRWGRVATIALLWGIGRLRGSTARRPRWTGLAAATPVLWLVARMVSVTSPVVETGTDPTQLPVGAMVPPLATTVLTVLAATIAGVFARPPQPS